MEFKIVKEILLGPLLAGTVRNYRSLRKHVSAGDSDSFLYLAASHPYSNCNGSNTDDAGTPGVWGEIPFIYSRIVRRILTTTSMNTACNSAKMFRSTARSFRSREDNSLI